MKRKFIRGNVLLSKRASELINSKKINIMDTLIGFDQEKSGFFDLPKQEKCNDKNHDAPSHIVIPQGKGCKHVCPSCGTVQIITPTQIRY